MAGNMILNELGFCIEDAWAALEQRFPRVRLDAHVTMPDHFHAILTLTPPSPPSPLPTPDPQSVVRAGSPRPPLPKQPTPRSEPLPRPRAQSPHAWHRNANGRHIPPAAHEPDQLPQDPNPDTLGRVIAHFKYNATRAINERREMPGVPVFHRGYYEHIIRDHRAWNNIDFYIQMNPERYAA